VSYRKGEDTPAKKRRRLTFRVAIEEREEPLRAADRAELEAECRRITNGAEFFYSMERNGERYEHVVRFAVEHQAAALAGWLRRERFAERSPPQFGPTTEEKAAFEQSALAWGFRTGAVRRVIQAFRGEPGSLTRQWSAAHQMLARYQMPEGQGFDVAAVFISWAQKHHWHWFHRRRARADSPFRPPDWYPPDDAYPHSDD
jgi:hypothetical protein